MKKSANIHILLSDEKNAVGDKGFKLSKFKELYRPESLN